MNYIAGFTAVFFTVCVLVQDRAEGLALYRRQDVNTGRYLNSPRSQSVDFDNESELPLSDASYEMEPDVPRAKDNRNRLTSEELVRRARRERKRLLLEATNAADDSEIETRGEIRYGAKYGTRDGKTGEDIRNTRSRQNISPEVEYDDILDDAVPSRATYDYKRLGNKTPETLRGTARNTNLKYKPVNVDDQSMPSDELESYDLKTLSAIIKNLRLENQDLDKTPKVEEGRRTGSYAKERELDTKVRTNSGGLQRTDVRSQEKEVLEDYLIPKTSTFKPRNVDQVTGRKAIEAKEHVLKLFTELEKLEELKSLQRGSENYSSQYYELKEEIAEDLRNIRNRVRQTIRENQQVM